MSNDKTPTVTEKHEIAKPMQSIGIPGLENIPMSILPIPFVKLVHGTSKNVFLADGVKKAAPGTFYHSDTKEVEEELFFALINSKFQKRMVEKYDKSGEMEEKSFLNILGLDLNSKELFIISLPERSAWRAFGQLMAQVRSKKLTAAWEHAVILKSVLVVTKDNEFQAPSFSLGERLASEDIQTAEKSYREYGSVLNTTIDDSAEAVEIPGMPNADPAEGVKGGTAAGTQRVTNPDTVNPEEEVDPGDIPF